MYLRVATMNKYPRFTTYFIWSFEQNRFFEKKKFFFHAIVRQEQIANILFPFFFVFVFFFWFETVKMANLGHVFRRFVRSQNKNRKFFEKRFGIKNYQIIRFSMVVKKFLCQTTWSTEFAKGTTRWTMCDPCCITLNSSNLKLYFSFFFFQICFLIFPLNYNT